MKTFHLGDILTVTTGRALSPTGLNAVKKLLDHMSGHTLFVFEIPRALQVCKPELLAQFPQFADIEVPRLATPDDYHDWVSAQVARFGEQHEVHRSWELPALALTAPSKES